MIPILNKDNQPTGVDLTLFQDWHCRNIKVLASYIAQVCMAKTQRRSLMFHPIHIGMKSKICTQQDIESDWSRYWINTLQMQFAYHRKNWELSYVLQSLYEYGMLESGKKGLGFACGHEPIPSFLASKECRITVSDKPENLQDDQQLGWKQSSQWMDSLDSVFFSNLVKKEVFASHVNLSFIDMNDIPASINETYDFCWSICAAEHLGSIKRGMDFFKNSISVLKPGGIAVHTTEYTPLDNVPTIDNWGSVFFQKENFLELSKEIKGMGHEIVPFDFNFGDGILDRYIDMPPFEHQSFAWMDDYQLPISLHPAPHIKLYTDGFPLTCIGIIIKK